MNHLHLLGIPDLDSRAFTVSAGRMRLYEGGGGGGEGGGDAAPEAPSAPEGTGKPGESNMSNAAAGLGPSAPEAPSGPATPEVAAPAPAAPAPAAPSVSTGKPGETAMAQAAASTPSMSSLDAALSTMAPTDFSLSSTPSTASRQGLGLTASSSGTVGAGNLSPASSGLAGMGLGLTAADLGLSGVGKGGFKGQDYSKADAFSLTNAPAQSYSDLAALDALGMGSLQLNDTYNQAQTVEQALAAKNVHDVLNATVPGLVGMMVPAGIPSLAWGVISGITSGRISSVSDVIGSLATNAIAGKLGIPSSAVDAALKGNMGQAVANLATSELSRALSETTGLPGGVIGAIGNATGATKGIQSEISNAVNDISGVSDINSAVSGTRSDLSNALNNLGTGALSNVMENGAGQNVNNAGGGADTSTGASTGTSTGTGTTSSTSSGTTTSTPSGTSYSSPSYSSTQSSNPTDLADIGYFFDPFGTDILAPKKAGTASKDALKSLYGSGLVARAAEGGSIDDLMEYLRK